MTPKFDLALIRFAVVLAQVAIGLLQFEADPNLTLPAYVTAKHLGAPVGDYTVSGALYMFPGDPCRRDPSEFPDLSGRVVVIVINDFACSLFRPYDLFAARNATAIVRNVTMHAGRDYLLWSLYDRKDRVEGDRTAALYVDLLWDPQSAAANRSLYQDGVRVQVRADISDWYVVQQSWWYQLGCRWGAALLYAVAFALSGTFLVQHGILIREKNLESSKSGVRLLAHTMSQITLIHLALAIAALKNGVMMFGALLGAFFSVAVLPFEIQMFLTTSLMGIESAVLIITARYWHQVISKSDHGRSSRAWSGPVSVLLSLFAIIADGTVAVIYASSELTGFQQTTILSMITLLFTFVTFVYFVCSLTRFRLQLRRSSVPTDDRRLSEFARRLSWRASWLTASLLAHLSCVVIFGSNRKIQEDPALFGMFVFTLSIVQPLRSALAVWMLQPRKNTSTRASVQTTSKRKSQSSGNSANKKALAGSGNANAPSATPTGQQRFSNIKLLPSQT